eukprot:1368417-Prymnesium_polylepis.2
MAARPPCSRRTPSSLPSDTGSGRTRSPLRSARNRRPAARLPPSPPTVCQPAPLCDPRLLPPSPPAPAAS